MTFAYADPPYPGCAAMYKGDASGLACEVNHGLLIAHLCEFDAWALSTHTPALRALLPACPEGTRVGSWVKPFASPRTKGGRGVASTRDWLSATPPCFRRRGTPTRGEKPWQFSFWMFALVGLQPDDEFHDLFPGSGAVGRAWEAWRDREKPIQLGLFAEGAAEGAPDATR